MEKGNRAACSKAIREPSRLISAYKSDIVEFGFWERKIESSESSI